MKKIHNTAFIVELLLLFILLLLVIVVITQTFMNARSRSLYAKHLTEAVCLAEEVAEVSMSAAGKEKAFSLFQELEQVKSAEMKDGQIELGMDFAGETLDSYQVILIMDEEDTEQGTYVSGEIRVFFGEAEEPLYTLTTGDYKAG